MQDSVEMYIASGNEHDAGSSANKLRVAPPRFQNSSASLAPSRGNNGSEYVVPTDHTRVLRGELRVTGAELRSKSAELSEARQIIR